MRLINMGANLYGHGHDAYLRAASRADPFNQTRRSSWATTSWPAPTCGRRRACWRWSGLGVEPGMADVFARYAQDYLFDEIEEIGHS